MHAPYNVYVFYYVENKTTLKVRLYWWPDLNSGGGDLCSVWEEYLRPSFHVIFFDNFVDYFPGAFSEQQKEGDEDDKEDEVGDQVLRDPWVAVCNVK